MQNYMYSAIAFVAIAIHLTINFDLLTKWKVVTTEGARYRSFLLGIFAYYVAAACWGVFAGFAWSRALYVNTMFYYIAIAVSVLTWCNFVIAYLDFSKWVSRAISWFGYGLLALYIALLAANIFNNCLFRFDGNGSYVSGPIRTMLFYPLVALNVLMAVFVFVKALGSKDSARRRNMVVFLFCLTMAVAIVFKIVWPLWPYYVFGCLLGSCFFHVFVIEDERAELRQAVIEKEQTAKHMAELEEALERARSAEKARSMFFSIVSHDIRTPLNAILGYSEMLQAGGQSPSERDEALESIRASGTTLLQLVNDVLDLAKMDAGKLTLRPEPVRLDQLTDEVFSTFRMAANSKGIALMNRTSEVPTVMLDEHRFRQILFNLVGNAVKFTQTGSVTVTGTYSGTVSAAYSGTVLEVAVIDTGCGIAPDMLTRILDPFVQVQDPSHSADRAGGTGLGLPICKSLVEAMGGELLVESELGKGSTFRARIPGIALGKTATATVQNVADVPHNLPKHVMVVDDSPVNRAVLTAFLKRAGIDSIDQATDGLEALAKLDVAMLEGRPHDFVLSDLWMPNMNGLEFIEKVRADARFGELPVFAVTADTESRQDRRTDLFTGILLKPMTYDKLVGVFAAMEKSGQ